MNPHNRTIVEYFIIQGLSDVPEAQAPIFVLILMMYMLTLGGNLVILLLFCTDHRLHMPMYFFLANLSIIDMCTSFITLHGVLLSFILKDKTIAVGTCMIQMYIFSSVTVDELLILMAMSYDRYTAICNPLYYHVVMSPIVCAMLVTLCWVLGFVQVFPIVFSLSSFHCYISNVIEHFFCDVSALMKLRCDDLSFLELYILINGSFLTIFPFFLTFFPYIFIIMAILKICSITSRRKAFQTCSSHVTVVTLFYVTLICQYLRPSSTGGVGTNKLFSLFNTAAVPLLNPLIYSLKNKDVMEALSRKLKLLHGKLHFLGERFNY
ncbi:olfactory receptor 8U9-like [Hyla sarda]|uniref:olfactory receptor 8U9-like n=1 Tax=Hyla sarda TaxID=327740 RepID=UPI0024C45F42|nr:olfactory receptor 8U9-like [Hyla sarda]